MRYDKYRWDEDRGDEYSHWGGSWWYFEVGADGYAKRQIEVYDSGIRLRYDAENIQDKFGGLSEGHDSQIDHSTDHAISEHEFELQWAQGPWHNVRA
jgi:hypothetical protein